MKFPCMLHQKVVELVKGDCLSGYVCPIVEMETEQCKVCNQMHGHIIPSLCDDFVCKKRVPEQKDGTSCYFLGALLSRCLKLLYPNEHNVIINRIVEDNEFMVMVTKCMALESKKMKRDMDIDVDKSYS